MRKIFSALAICMAAAMIISLAACGENDKNSKETATVSSTSATTASLTKSDGISGDTSEIGSGSDLSSNSGGGSDLSSDSDKADADDSQDVTSPPGQDRYNNQQQAINEAIGRAAQLYGDGDWRHESITETPSADSSECYYIGVRDWSVTGGKLHYFYVSPGSFCYEDESTAGGGSDGSGEELSDESRQVAISNAMTVALQMYGNGDWREYSCDQTTSPDGTACWYVGIINDETSKVYYFYSSESFTYADQAANAG